VNLSIGHTATFFVQIGTPRSEGQTIGISVDPAGAVRLPSSLSIPAGATTGTFDVIGLARGDANITVTMPPVLGGGIYGVAVHVLDPGVLIFDPPALTLAAGSTATVKASMNPPRASAVAVSLESSDPAIAGVPASITIPAGGSTTFNVKALARGGAGIIATLPNTFAQGTGNLSVIVVDRPTSPMLTGINPSFGPTVGGTAVTLTGANLDAGCGIAFGGIPAASRVVDASTITATSPAHIAGTVGITLTCGSAVSTLAAAFTYIDAAPSLSSVTPSFGGGSGRTMVKMTGANFGAGCWAFFDGTPARGAKVLSTTMMTASTPPHALGTVDVSVRCGTIAATLSRGFSYSTNDDPGPMITGVDPLSGSAGQTVTIAGVRLRPDAVVTFGAAPATILGAAPDALIVRIPDLPLGRIAVNVADNAAGISTTGPIFTVLEPLPPQIDSVTPAIAAPGGEVTITGRGFRPGYVIAFGGKTTQYVSLEYGRAVLRLPRSLVAGTYAAEALNASGQTASFGPSLTVVEGGLAITSISPRCATTDGGVEVTIGGTGFGSGAKVTFNGIPATSVALANPGTLIATAPPNMAGTARVVVTNPNGDTASMSDAFRYDSPFDPNGDCAAMSKPRAAH
jgi:hypothetical protein